MKKITFRMTAYTAAAGKYSENSPNKGNEDNFFVSDDLTNSTPPLFTTDKTVKLSECGMIMVVADGMGGMNAGEVASEIVINTVKEYFSPQIINPSIAVTHNARKQYMEKVIVAADKNIKKEARANPEYEGMGSTIIMAWLVGEELTVSWCGDSRAYRYSPLNGLKQLSKDHSYVQDLVDFYGLDPELAFDHPQGNIITRSLGDSGKKAEPQTLDKPYKVSKGDIIMLCSDGLNGVLRDNKMEAIIQTNCSSMQVCREALWLEAEGAGWYDNVTTILCEILDGAPEAVKEKREDSSLPVIQPKESKSFWEKSMNIRLGSRKGLFGFLAAVLLLLVVGIVLWKNHSPSEDNEEIKNLVDVLQTRIDSICGIILYPSTTEKEMLEKQKERIYAATLTEEEIKSIDAKVSLILKEIEAKNVRHREDEERIKAEKVRASNNEDAHEEIGMGTIEAILKVPVPKGVSPQQIGGDSVADPLTPATNNPNEENIPLTPVEE